MSFYFRFENALTRFKACSRSTFFPFGPLNFDLLL
jgi:hypothetical protein